VFVDPLAPFLKIVRPTLIGDALECSDSYAIMQRYRDCSFFASLWVCVFRNRVVTPCAIVSIAKLSKNIDDFLARKIP